MYGRPVFRTVERGTSRRPSEGGRPPNTRGTQEKCNWSPGRRDSGTGTPEVRGRERVAQERVTQCPGVSSEQSWYGIVTLTLVNFGGYVVTTGYHPVTSP